MILLLIELIFISFYYIKIRKVYKVYFYEINFKDNVLNLCKDYCVLK